MTKGIKRRWLFNSLSLLISVVIILVVVFFMIIKSYFYSYIRRNLNETSSVVISNFDNRINYSEDDFLVDALDYIKNLSDQDSIYLMVIDSNDQVVAISEELENCQEYDMKDYYIAKNSPIYYGYTNDKDKNGDHYMAVTRSVYNKDGVYLGAIRYVSYLGEIDNRIVLYLIPIIVVSVFLVLFVALSNTYFIKSILVPMQEISVTAKKIAQGNFDAKISKKYEDEIGELCDTINYMANELGSSEKLKNDFISSVSHELRTPLTAIKGWAETMEMSPQADRKTTEKGLKIIIAEAERLSGIVEELLDFSKMQNGRMALMMDKIDILAELDEAIYMFKDRAKSEGKELIYEEPMMVSPVLGDKNRLKQVFINILDNAIKYTQEGSTIIVKVLEEKENIKIIVTDDGVGISAEDLPKVKDKFYKANQTQRGSGIGLALADEIMKLHFGSLEIASEEGIGSVVTISIPIIQSDNNEADS